MRRSDRRSGSDDNSLQYPHSRLAEPTSAQELRVLLNNVRAQRDEAKETVVVREQQAAESHQLYLGVQQNLQSTMLLCQEAQAEATSYLALYSAEQVRSNELLGQYNQAQAESQHYLTLYQTTEQALKTERRSKAGIKSWETRRKRENTRLKQEIGEMTVLLRRSMSREGVAITNLEELAMRMDRIQSLVDSVDAEGANNPVGLVHKLQRLWGAIKEILAE